MRMFEEYFRHAPRSIREQWVGTTHLVDITQVARWFYEDAEPGQYDLEKDFPSLALPWPAAWMEYEQPKTVRIGSRVHENPLAGRHAAGLLMSIPVIDGEWAFRTDVMVDVIAMQYGRPAGPDFVASLRAESQARRGRLDALIEAGSLPEWVLVAHMLQDFPGQGIHGWGAKYIYLDEHGRAFGDLEWTLGAERCGASRDVHFTPIAFAISMLHCKNVHLEDAPPPARVLHSRKQRRAPKLTYKTLVVDPLRRQIRRQPAEGAGEEGQATRALHIARGHFKDYREGGGLFGKLHGLYWWDMHVRGSAEAGAVLKDYEVRPGRSERDVDDQRPRR